MRPAVFISRLEQDFQMVGVTAFFSWMHDINAGSRQSGDDARTEPLSQAWE